MNAPLRFAPLCLCLSAGAASAQVCEPQWSATVGSPGLNSPASFFKAFDDGNGPALYTGGSFTSAGGGFAERIARWNGTDWSPVGAGLSAQVYALAEFDDGTGPALYAGGLFTFSGATNINRVARWDGTQWNAVGGGTDGDVYVLAVFDDGNGPALYAGGRFTNAGGVAANSVARWNGTSWSAVGSGVSSAFIDATVESMLVFDDGAGPALYAGGFFDQAGGQTAGGIARWNGTAWSSPGGGISPFAQIISMAAFDDGSGPKLHAGGSMGVHRWTGSWESLNVDGYTTAMAVFDQGASGGPHLYIGGSFNTAGGVSSPGIARWDGSAFTTVGAGLSGAVITAVYALGVFDGALYAGGFFDQAAGQAVGNIAAWVGCSSAPCYANCDGSTIAPILNVDDFTCFINEFAAAQSLPHEAQVAHYANCDGSTIAPALNVDDFTCFINAFAAGCP